MLLTITIFVWSVAFLTDVALVVFWQLAYKNPRPLVRKWPTVDVLIAARNEEDYLPACLQALTQVDYPKDKLTIWVGDDNSTDNTWQIIERFAHMHPFIKGVKITDTNPNINGKAHVLSRLAGHSQATWMFFTDADIQVPDTWIKAMLQGAKAKQASLVTGTSLVQGSSWLAHTQRLEWLNATAMLKLISDLGVPVASMGNNMALKRTAYQAIGGFESLPFSVTEDLELFKAVKKKFTTVNLFNAELLNKSEAQPGLLPLLKQRKRWMRGAFELPWQLLGLLVIQVMYFPAIVVVGIINPPLGLSLWLTKWVTKFTFQQLSAKKIKENISIFHSFATEGFTMFFSMASLLYYFWPGKVAWKGRTY